MTSRLTERDWLLGLNERLSVTYLLWQGLILWPSLQEGGLVSLADWALQESSHSSQRSCFDPCLRLRQCQRADELRYSGALVMVLKARSLSIWDVKQSVSFFWLFLFESCNFFFNFYREKAAPYIETAKIERIEIEKHVPTGRNSDQT